MLEDRFQDLQRTLDRERGAWQQKLHQKEEELLSMRSQMFSQLEDYESLLDVKLALDMEINAYRKMLEVEEQRWGVDHLISADVNYSSLFLTSLFLPPLRLHLSPSPSQRTTIPRTHEHGSHKFRGKKRKREDVSGSSPAYKMFSRMSEQTSVSVAEVDVDGKFVRLKNNSETVRLRHGWTI